MTPVICCVTSRQTFGPGWRTGLVAHAAAAARAGIHLLQVRERDLEAGELYTLVRDLLDAVGGTRCRVVVNERADVALAAGADGVHLRAASVAAARIREIAPPGWLIGRSIHSVAEAVAAERDGGCSYLLFGTVFPTASKPGVPAAGPGPLRDAAASVALPVLAIGGVDLATIGDVARSGAAGFAAVGLFAREPAERLQTVVREATLAFDTPRTRP